MSNPFSISFGLEPKEYISRHQQTDRIIGAFTEESPSNHTFMLSGIRGSGKTVLLANITETFEKKKDWIVINTSPDMDILNSIAAHLYGRKSIHTIFTEAKIDLSGIGIGISLKNATPIYDISVALERLLEEISKKKLKVLIAIDEIVNNHNVRAFSGIYQILLRKKLPVFLLMTGLYENINNLQNEKTLTFLYRAPKVYLEPLNRFSISTSYKKVLGIDDKTAKEMAYLTNGYAYAYQVLGYLYWENVINDQTAKGLSDILNEYDSTLSEYVYEKIWFELPETESKVVALLVKNGQMKNKDIREKLSLSDSQMAVYRDRLKRRGIIDTSRYGYFDLLLPRFREIVSFWID